MPDHDDRELSAADTDRASEFCAGKKRGVYPPDRGDAQEVLPTLTGSYDFIFMDAAKGQYPIFLPEIKRLMHSGSVMVTDNVLQDGDLIESHYAIERRNRTIHKRMRGISLQPDT